MSVERFLSSRLKPSSRMASVCIIISFIVMILAVAISSGFRNEIGRGISDICGDVRITPANMDILSGNKPIKYPAPYLNYVDSLDGVCSVTPVVYRAGLVRSNETIHGVMFKGVPGFSAAHDSLTLAVSIPSRLASMLKLQNGDKLQSYFIGDKLKARSFRIVEVYDAVLESDDQLVVKMDIADLQRINAWTSEMVSAYEILLEDNSIKRMTEVADETGFMATMLSGEDEGPLISVPASKAYPQMFDWLELIDFNVLVILLLMTVVAGFNMISGLLIMLFENISTIGLLKSLGMNDRPIAKVFLMSSSRVILKGMIIGNAAAILLCLLQDATHILTLSPENYFLSFVPVHLDFPMILLADLCAYLVIMAFLFIPSLFISKVDPARTVRVR